MNDLIHRFWKSFVRYAEAMEGNSYPLERIRALDQKVAALKVAAKVRLSTGKSANDGQRTKKS